MTVDRSNVGPFLTDPTAAGLDVRQKTQKWRLFGSMSNSELTAFDRCVVDLTGDSPVYFGDDSPVHFADNSHSTRWDEIEALDFPPESPPESPQSSDWDEQKERRGKRKSLKKGKRKKKRMRPSASKQKPVEIKREQVPAEQPAKETGRSAALLVFDIPGIVRMFIIPYLIQSEALNMIHARNEWTTQENYFNIWTLCASLVIRYNSRTFWLDASPVNIYTTAASTMNRRRTLVAVPYQIEINLRLKQAIFAELCLDEDTRGAFTTNNVRCRVLVLRIKTLQPNLPEVPKDLKPIGLVIESQEDEFLEEAATDIWAWMSAFVTKVETLVVEMNCVTMKHLGARRWPSLKYLWISGTKRGYGSFVALRKANFPKLEKIIVVSMRSDREQRKLLISKLGSTRPENQPGKMKPTISLGAPKKPLEEPQTPIENPAPASAPAPTPPIVSCGNMEMSFEDLQSSSFYSPSFDPPEQEDWRHVSRRHGAPWWMNIWVNDQSPLLNISSWEFADGTSKRCALMWRSQKKERREKLKEKEKVKAISLRDLFK